ncbi:MAG: hypothetical protein QOG43_2140 [Actinomycetota bacterium]|nr:hypothetical protein [Actinomycetota bacterium]
MWAPAVEGVLRVSVEGIEQGVVDLGVRASTITAGEASIWATTSSPGPLLRVGMDDLDVKGIDIGGPVDFVVAGDEGLWAFRRSDSVLLHVAPTADRIVGEVQLEGGCYGIGLSNNDVVVAFTTNRAMRGGLARISRATGELVGVVQRDSLPSGLVVFDDEAWIATNLWDEVGDLLGDEDATMPEARSAVERIDLRLGIVLDTVSVPGQILDVVGNASRMLALVFSRDAQAIQVVPIDPASGSVGATIDFSGIDLAGFSEPPPRNFGPFGEDPPPQLQEASPATSPKEVEERVRVVADDAVHSTVQGMSGRTGELLPPRPFIRGCIFEPVRLAGEHPDTRLQFIFRSERHANCRFGWEVSLWHDGDSEGGDSDDVAPGLPDPENFAGDILLTLMENLEAAGYGPPDECDPDKEGITWVTNPYGEKPSWEWDFADEVEWALRQYEPASRPVSRALVQQLLATGVDSRDALVNIVTGDRTDDLASAALWLLGQFRDAAAVGPLLAGLEFLDEPSRLRTVAKLRVLVGREHEPDLQRAFLAETAGPVRAALMDTLFHGGATTRDLALSVFSDHREASAVRVAAALTLGCTSVGEPDVVAALVSALDDPNADLVVGAARGLAHCVPSQATRLLTHLERDSRMTSAGDTVGSAVAEEVEALQRRRC